MNQKTEDFNEELKPSSHLNQQDPNNKKHSGFGIASTIIGVIVLVTSIISIVIISAEFLDFATNFKVSDPSVLNDEEAIHFVINYPSIISGTVLLLASVFFMFIGGILGIIGLFQQTRKKLFAIVGTLLNGIPILLFIIIVSLSVLIG